MNATPKFISPSRVARFYFHECARYLRYSSTPAESRSDEGVPPAPYDFRPITKAIFETGFLWEEQVLADHLSGKVHISQSDPDAPVRERVLSAEETKSLLTGIEPGEWIYQPTLVTPTGFYDRYGIDPGVVQVTDCRPDLIECFEEDGRRLLRVTDVKASTGVKLSHRIQSTMYSLILDHVLEDWEASDQGVATTGGVWLSQTPEPEHFDIRSMRPPLEAFLEQELQPLMEAPASEAPWHVYFRCEWCDYFDHCKEEMLRTNDVSRVPYLSHHAKQYLATLDPAVKSVRDLERLANGDQASEVFANAASLRGRTTRIRLQTEALRVGETKVTGTASIAMPKAEHVRIVLTLQDEPVTGHVYAYGIYAQGLKDVLGENPKPLTDVARKGEPETIRALEHDFIVSLHALLSRVDEYNLERDGDWYSQKSLQVFAFDSYEWTLLTNVLLRGINDRAVAEEALQVFLFFQQPELLEAKEHPATEVFFPLVTLVTVLRQMFALPLDVTYRFRDVVELLQPTNYAFDYRPDEYLTFQLSNQMRADAIYAMWHRGEDNHERIARGLRNRLWATNSLVNGIRERLESEGDLLFAWPPKFRLPDSFPYQHVVLSRLAFLARYESVLDYLAVRTARMAPLDEQLRSGAALRLTYDGDDRFVVDPIHRDLDIHATSFPQWILTEDSDAGIRARQAYYDYGNRSRVWVPKNLPIALAGVTSIESTPETPNLAIHLDLKSGQMSPGLRPGVRYLLGQRMTDFLTDRAIGVLQEIDGQADPHFVRLIERPNDFIAPLEVPDVVRGIAIRLGERHGMTPSQLKALRGIVDRNLELVWGPPGTGKTHFLGLAILCLAAAHRAAGLPFRVLLAAFTHAAIDNCLRKMAQLNGELGVVDGDLTIAKLGSRTLPDMPDVDEMVDKSWVWPSATSVVGGTVWAIRKGGGDQLADLVVIDEGSQMQAPPSSIAIRRLKPEGRLLIAGDHRQLPPIIQGWYPDPAEGDPLLHRSLFECLRLQDVDDRFTVTLLENFRMNRTLCRFPAEQIYVAGYDSADPIIGSRRLGLLDGDDDPLANAIIDPDFPLVVGVLEGVRATAENVVEAELVTRVTQSLRDRLFRADGRSYEDSESGDEDFWKYGLFIVSPHHAQINAVVRALSRARRWRSQPFVDTVDKIQGQECDAVIATYGVSDVEYAMGEKEFIYSLNRLNVSITRARAKTIVFLPRPLIEPPIVAYEDDRIAEGIAFMQGLVQYAQRHGESTNYPLSNGVDLTVFRVPAVT
jgi:hypothetical protein